MLEQKKKNCTIFASIFKNMNHSTAPGSTKIYCVFPLSPWDACDSMNTIRPKKGKAVKMFISYTAVNIPVKGICKWLATGEKISLNYCGLFENSSQNVFHIFCVLTHFTNLSPVPDLSTSYWIFRLVLTSITGFQIILLTNLTKAYLEIQITAHSVSYTCTSTQQNCYY